MTKIEAAMLKIRAAPFIIKPKNNRFVRIPLIFARYPKKRPVTDRTKLINGMTKPTINREEFASKQNGNNIIIPRAAIPR